MNEEEKKRLDEELKNMSAKELKSQILFKTAVYAAIIGIIIAVIANIF